jgi:SAM-dependent methyltransferase
VDAKLSYFVEWRPALWTPAVRWLIGAPERFRGKRVLDLGCRYGRMSCLFGLLGADVTGVELEDVSLERARQEAIHWNVAHRVQFVQYNGDPLNIPGFDYDFVFTKSVLVIVPQLSQFLVALADRLKPGGELMMAENFAGSRELAWLRRVLIHRLWSGFDDQFHGVDSDFLATVAQTFDIVAWKCYFGLVASISARKKSRGDRGGSNDENQAWQTYL